MGMDGTERRVRTAPYSLAVTIRFGSAIAMGDSPKLASERATHFCGGRWRKMDYRRGNQFLRVRVVKSLRKLSRVAIPNRRTRVSLHDKV